jgi:hypothetical protein
VIGNKYKYYNSDKVFTVKSFNGWRYKFECGHWCSDSIFNDLINVETGISNKIGRQLKLNI